MSVEYSTSLSIVIAMMQQAMAETLNRAARKHLDWSDFRVPIDKGNLRDSNRQTEVATPLLHRAVVVSGGITAPDGTIVNYAAAVNNGSHHVSPSGTEYSIPPNPYWTEGEEEGRKVMIGADAVSLAAAAVGRSKKAKVKKRIYGPGEEAVWFVGGVAVVD